MTSQDRINLRARIETMPRVQFVCGRDWMRGPYGYEFGVLWDRNLDAKEGEWIYRRRMILCWRFRIWLDRS